MTEKKRFVRAIASGFSFVTIFTGVALMSPRIVGNVIGVERFTANFLGITLTLIGFIAMFLFLRHED